MPRVTVEDQNAIACENCRTKKCKCDRALPVCTQCVSTGATCEYPRENKRGIPAGYVASLEKRLAQTEAALYIALTSSPTNLGESPSADELFKECAMRFHEHNSAQSRADRLRRWSDLPLASTGNLQVWRAAMEHLLAFSNSDASQLDFATETPLVEPDNIYVSASRDALSGGGRSGSWGLRERPFVVPPVQSDHAMMNITDDFSYNSTTQSDVSGHDVESSAAALHTNAAEKLSRAERQKYF